MSKRPLEIGDEWIAGHNPGYTGLWMVIRTPKNYVVIFQKYPCRFFTHNGITDILGRFTSPEEAIKYASERYNRAHGLGTGFY